MRHLLFGKALTFKHVATFIMKISLNSSDVRESTRLR